MDGWIVIFVEVDYEEWVKPANNVITRLSNLHTSTKHIDNVLRVTFEVGVTLYLQQVLIGWFRTHRFQLLPFAMAADTHHK